ncbi:MAG: winged helix-turn-helix domain-containing tetratricopeptide repeat protein [Woeseiaceae bacterium]
MPSKEELDKGFRIGDWEVYPARGEMRRGDQVEKPEPKVLKVLISLAMRGGDLVTKDDLVNEVWDGRATSDDPIIRCIFQLRKHLNDRERPYQYVGTLVRRGYNLEKPVELLREDAANHVSQGAVQARPTRLWALLGLAVALLIAGLVYKGVTVSPNTKISSILVLPFENLTGNPDDAAIASGFKQELSHTLQNIPGLVVKNGGVGHSDLEIGRIAFQLEVDAILSGALQRQGEQLKFSYQLVRGHDAVIVSSGVVSGTLENLFGLQEELAGKVRSHVVGGSDKSLLSLSQPANFEAYERYIRGMFALERRGVAGNLEEAIALFEEAIQLDPNYGPAYLALAEIYVLLPDYRGADLVESHTQAIEIVQEGIAMDPAIENAAGAVIGFVYHKQKKWALAEQAFQRATSAAVVESNAFNWYSLMLGSVGRFEESLQMALAAIEIDPGSAVINSRVAIVYTWRGDAKRAAEYFERSRQLGAEGATHRLANALLVARLGDMEEAQDLAITGVLLDGGSTNWVGPFFAALAEPAKRDLALAAIDDAAANAEVELQVEATLRMLLGDVDGALAVSRKIVTPSAALETELFFLPEFEPLRQRPEFLELMDTIGVTDYWEEAGCVWEDLEVECD